MSYRPRVLVDLAIIATLHCLVAKEMDGLVVDTTGQVLLVLDVLQTVPLIPALREDVEGDLATD